MLVATALGAMVLALAPSAPARAAPKLQVGVGRADITPPTGYYMMGWVRSDAKVIGQHTRLWARVIVLKRGQRKVALVSEDLNGIPGGMMAAAANRVAGFSQRNVLDSASHTHAAPTGFYNFPTYNTVFMTIHSPADFQLTGDLDPQLYAFEVRRLAKALRRADTDLGPGKIGWGTAEITNLTKNRSLEAHLYDHGIHEPYGAGRVSEDPKGRLHTIDPQVNVLRVDKIIGGRGVPVGIWSTFANHGTVNHFQFTFYNEDHHGAATHLVERAIRRRGNVPRGQDVVAAYGNTDEGDQSSGLDRWGPAYADHVGTVEARRFMTAWRRAGRHMDQTPELARRWTRMCFCGQDTAEGPVADAGVFGQAEFTGSEEGRGPLFDVTRVPFEGDHLPVGTGPQGDKIQAPVPLDVPKAVPLMAIQVGDREIVSIPGEMTAEMGRRVRHAVEQAARGHGIDRAVISGLANEYADYFTTPEEYDAQHYEGAATVYGRASSVALQETLVKLTRALVTGTTAPRPYAYDPRNGVGAKAPPFPRGAKRGNLIAQPKRGARRLLHPTVVWQGAPRGYDRPLDRAFVKVPAPHRRPLAHRHVGPRVGRAVARRFRRRLPRRVGAGLRPPPRHVPVPDHGEPLHPHLTPIPAAAVVAAQAAARRRPGRRGRGSARLSEAGRSRGRRRAAAGRAREPHRAPRARALRQGHVRGRRPSPHGPRRSRRAVRAPCRPGRRREGPRRRRPRPVRQLQRHGPKTALISRCEP